MQAVCEEVIRRVLAVDGVPAHLERKWRERLRELANENETTRETETGHADNGHYSDNPYLRIDSGDGARGGAASATPLNVSDQVELCSDDDDDDDCYETDKAIVAPSAAGPWRGDLIVGYYKTVRRQRTRWCLQLVDCVALIGGREYALANVCVEASFS